MPSFAALASLALLFAASPALAFESSELDIAARAIDLTDSVFARSELAKRRPNHADAYGYPHNQGPHKGSGKMTPGGYKDPKKPNEGAECHRDSECHTHVSLGAAQCQAGKCGFRCLGDTQKQGNSCVGMFHAQSCKHDWNCKTTVAHATPVCSSKLCTFQCDAGYTASGNTCVKSAPTCGRHSCKPVENGTNSCVHGKCQPQCETYLGYALYTNQDESIYRCINTSSDPENCGSVGHVCPPGYNHHGHPTCNKGQCGLDCSGWGHKGWKHGLPYCTKW